MTALSTLKSVARALKINAVVNHCYRRPLSTMRQSLREGGPLEQRRTEQGRRAMVHAARDLPPLTRRVGQPCIDLHFMTGRKYWYQTIFCFYSLYLVSDVDFQPIVVDDGTIDAEVKSHLSRVIPWITFRDHAEIVASLDANLPESRYPVLRSWRLRQPLTRKIIDVHCGQTGWKMLLDSDMLFFRRPDWLIAWGLKPERPAFMVDCVEAYGYSEALRARVCGSRAFPDRANIGFFGWKSEETDFDWLEYAIKTLVEHEGPAYNITQGLTSMMFAGRECAIAPEHDYVVLPSLQEGRSPTATLHHYVSETKRAYFQYGWKHIMRNLKQP
jgi:hypothetical protein